MATVILPSSLAGRANGRGRIALGGATAGEVLQALEREHPELRGWVLDERGRLRRHVSLFVNSESADLERPVTEGDRVHVVQAISGGLAAAADGGRRELFVGTKKGLFLLREEAGEWSVAHREFAGQVVEYALRDRRTGLCFAAVTHGQFGPRLFRAEDPTGDWEQAEGPVFPPETETALERIWVIQPGEEPGVLWAGVAPAALFRSEDDGRTWELNRPFWDQPSRKEWSGGLGGLCLHSICPWRGDPDRLALAISAVGIWITDDRGKSWTNHHRGLVPRYLPEEARADTIAHCVHKLERSPVEPDTLYLQFHGGVYRSDDRGESWTDIGTEGGLPADFGFPLVVDPRDPARAFVIPLVADHYRVTPDGRIRVYETRDRGATWRPLERGLPQQDAWATVLRQSFCHDGREPLGLYFGTEQGAVYASIDGGASWKTAAGNLAPVLSVRA